MDETYPVSIAGAEELIVTWDPSCATEAGIDTLQIYLDEARQVWSKRNRVCFFFFFFFFPRVPQSQYLNQPSVLWPTLHVCWYF